MFDLDVAYSQATLEIEFMHQTLSQHVSPIADATLQQIYRTISQSYYRRPSPDGAGELQQELEGLKRTLMQSRRSTALQFLAFKKSKKVEDGAVAVVEKREGSERKDGGS